MFAVRLSFCTLLSLLAISLGQALQAAPVVSGQIADQTLYRAAPAKEIDLTTKFNDPALPANTVRMTVVAGSNDAELGDIDVTLEDQKTPITVDNFLRYIDSGAYLPPDPNFDITAPVFFHRSVANFVIQSGGFIAAKDPISPPDLAPGPVTTFSPIPNEARPDLHNVRGTIAMAKLADDPDSATSQWFINLADNSENLDNQNEGFTVFGTISDAGMETADAVAAVPVFNAGGLYGSAFTNLPLQDYSSSEIPEVDNTVKITRFVRPLRFTATSDHPNLAKVSVISNDLFVQGLGTGTATVTVTATDSNGAAATQSFEVTIETPPVHAANISTRLEVGTDDDALIGGFIVRGNTPKRLIIRAVGPSLAPDVSNPLSDPTLELHNASGAIIASNDNWETAPNKRDIMNSGLAPTDPAEAAILTTVPATSNGSAYTAVIHNAAGTSGIGLVEVYDLDSGPGASVLNISTRGNVQTGEKVMIGGFIISGEGSQQVLVRALGPSLAGAGVADPLANPTLSLVNSQGTQIDFNDDWQNSPDAEAIEATTIPPTDPKESAVLQTLQPGGYTAIVNGANGGTGTGLVEVYVLQSL